MESKFFLNDGTIISNNNDLEVYLDTLGFDLEELTVVLNGFNEYEHLQDCVREYELLADHNRLIADDLRDVVEYAIDKLESGKSGKGYTKIDIANLLSKAIDEYNANM